MSDISLPKLKANRQSVYHKVRFDADVADDLEMYGRFYESVYGHKVKPRDLVPAMVQKVMANDRGFQKFKRSQQTTSRSTAQPATPVAKGK